MTSVILPTPPRFIPLIRALAGLAFLLLAVGLLDLFAPNILPFSVQKEVAIALIVIGAATELASAMLVIKTLRQHGRKRLHSALQEARMKDKS